MIERKKYSKLLIWSLLPIIITVFLVIRLFEVLDSFLNNYFAFNRFPQDIFEMLVNIGIVTVFVSLIAVTLIFLGLKFSKKRILRIIFTFSTIIILFSTILTFYSYNFIFSENIDHLQVDLQLPAFYSDKYLEKVGFINRTHGMETWFCVGKTDKFTWNIAGISFTDTFSICLNTAYNIKPCYFGYEVEMDSVVDNRFIFELQKNNIKYADIEPIDIPNALHEYYKIDDETSLERTRYTQGNHVSNTTYRVFKNAPGNLFNLFEKILIVYVNFLHS